MDEESLKIAVLFGLPLLALLVGYYFIDKESKKEEKEKAQTIKDQ